MLYLNISYLSQKLTYSYNNYNIDIKHSLGNMHQLSKNLDYKRVITASKLPWM